MFQRALRMDGPTIEDKVGQSWLKLRRLKVPPNEVEDLAAMRQVLFMIGERQELAEALRYVLFKAYAETLMHYTKVKAEQPHLNSQDLLTRTFALCRRLTATESLILKWGRSFKKNVVSADQMDVCAVRQFIVVHSEVEWIIPAAERDEIWRRMSAVNN